RLDMVNTFRVGGIVVNNLFVPGNNTGAMTAINEYKGNLASSIPNSLGMLWTVNGASGPVLSQNVGLGTPFVWQAADQGDYTIQGAMVRGGGSARGAVAIKVAALATTPPPTQAFVTRAPSGPSSPTQPPAATAPPPVVGSVSTAAGFELGGQVPGGIGH